MLVTFFCYTPVCTGESQKLDKVILQLKWKHQFQFAGYYAAQENGYYKDAGLDVTILEARPGVDPVEQVLEGKADFGVADGKGEGLIFCRGEIVKKVREEEMLGELLRLINEQE